MPIKLVECLDWPAVNRPGELLRYAEHFKKEGVNLDAFWAYVSHTGETKLAAIAKKPAALKAALRKLGTSSSGSWAFYLSGKDKAGALVEACEALSSSGINIECADALAAQGKFAGAIWVGESDLAAAKKALKVR